MTNRIYLDYCATTPVHPEVIEAMRKIYDEDYGNPSSMHQFGMDAKNHLEDARSAVAAGIGCDANEVFFTSGATEADNLALFGVMRLYHPGKAHMITTAIEHHAVLHAAEQLEREGYDITILPVDSKGMVDPDEVASAITPETKLVSIMMVNNEVGSVQKLHEIGEITSSHGILFHTDAVQGVGLLNLELDAWHVDLLSLSAHKIYGPKGVGALFKRHEISLLPVIYGGPQESELRPGTENLPGIVGLGAAMQLISRQKTSERRRLTDLRAWFIDALKAEIPGFLVNGPENVSPHILSISIPGAIAEMMQFRLNRENIAVSLGSACTSKDIEPSHVLLAMGMPHDQIDGTLRISFGYLTTRTTLESVCQVLPDIWRRSISS